MRSFEDAGVSAKDTKKSLYHIADPFLSFHYRFVAPNRSFIELGRNNVVDNILEQHFTQHVGYWWERLCRDAVTGNTINGVTYSQARRWWGRLLIDGQYRDVELDVVAESLDGKHLLIGECKWSKRENGRALTNELQKIAAAFPYAMDKKTDIVLFTRNTPEEDMGNSILPHKVIELNA